MLNSILAALTVIIPVALITGALVYLRPFQLVATADIETKGVETAAREYATGSVIGTSAIGLLVALLYTALAARWPEIASGVYLVLGIVLCGALSLAAAILRPRWRKRGLPEVILMNVLWGAGFGYLLPLAIHALASP